MVLFCVSLCAYSYWITNHPACNGYMTITPSSYIRKAAFLIRAGGRHGARQTALMRERVARNEPLADLANTGFWAECDVIPVYEPERSRNPMPGVSFSAQLLELGLKYNVEGLVKKAQAQLGRSSSTVWKNHLGIQHYERAQENFSDDTTHMVERHY